jgi:hypothetical protein
MIACRHGGDYLPVVKMLLYHPKIQVNQRDEVIITESNILVSFCFS